MNRDRIEFEDLGFSPSYRCTVLAALPTNGPPHHRFFWQKRPHEFKDGLYLRVVPHGEPAWVGQFQKEDSFYPSGVFACPSPDHLCVVSGGVGYIVPVRDPKAYDNTYAAPVHGVRRVPDRQMLVMWDEQDVVAYGPDGPLWRVEHIGGEEFAVTEVTPHTVRGTVVDPSQDKKVRFEVDLDTLQLRSEWHRPRLRTSFSSTLDG